MNTSPLISTDRITQRFPGVVALRDVSLDIAAGELRAIVGENGAGKSTLMKILAGIHTGYVGDLRLRGQVVRFGGTGEAEAAGISIIHQELNLVEQLSVAANLFLGREKRTSLGLLDDREMERIAGELLRDLECLAKPRQLVAELRVGDQQLVEIAKALSIQTEVLIMDEPTSALTETEVARLYRVIGRLRERGVTILYISHKLDEVFRLADRITVLRDGQLIRTLEARDTTPREIAHLMVGRDVESFEREAAPSSPLPSGDSPTSSPLPPGEGSGVRERGAKPQSKHTATPPHPSPLPGGEGTRASCNVLLEVANLSLPWSGHARQWRLKDISFQLRSGEVLGVAGLMGAGRTELLECLFGAAAERPTGTIQLEGRTVAFEHPAEAVSAGVALVTEDRKRLGLFSQMTVGQNISLCAMRHTVSAGFVRPRRERELALQTAKDLSVRMPGIDAAITGLSGGNQQKCIIGRWLLTKPKVLLLDDPTRGVDVGAKAELYRLIRRLCRDGIGVIVTSSELPELLILCDRILVLCEGRLTGEFRRSDASEQAIMEAATKRSMKSEV
jgi:ABC-type sugar transport system ATPase subunit